MNILLLSDLHMERGFGYKPPEDDSSYDAVVLAGDIHSRTNASKWARNTFKNKEIILILGNHEYYGERWDNLIGKTRIEADSYGVRFLENDKTEINGITFLGCTLWTDFEFFGKKNKEVAMMKVQSSLNDYRAIYKDESRQAIKAVDTLSRHIESREWLNDSLEKCSKEKTVVITHHYPSIESTAKIYKKDIVTAGFGSKLDDLLEKSSVWIHGHTHKSFNYKRKGCRVLCNPKGYEYSNGPENHEFDPKMIISI